MLVESMALRDCRLAMHREHLSHKPDVEVELDEELKSMVEIPREEDNQLHKAVEVLVQKVNK